MNQWEATPRNVESMIVMIAFVLNMFCLFGTEYGGSTMIITDH